MLEGAPPAAANAIARYESIQNRLPTASFPKDSYRRSHLGELVDDIDCFVLDGFGVLNVGESAVPGAVERISALRNAGKQLRVLTNGATLPVTNTCAKYRNWGMEFDTAEVVSSRDALAVGLKQHATMRWGFAAVAQSQLHELAPDSVLLDDNPATYDQCDGFVLLGTREWNYERQCLLRQSLSAHPRPVFVGNPDLVAPHPSGLSREPGLYAHDLWDLGLSEPEFFGKPFDNAFALVRSTMSKIPNARIAMVGDTLHTDILGGAQAGWKTVLVADHGLFKGQNLDAAIKRNGIIPDYIIPTT